MKSNDGDTALQIMIKRQRLPCVMALLSRSVDASSVGSEGNNALHLAISVSSRWSINWYLAISVVFCLELMFWNKFLPVRDTMNNTCRLVATDEH